MTQITGLGSLRYLHILSVYGEERGDIEGVLSGSPPPSLELFGYNQDMHWVSHGRSDASMVELSASERWPYSRVQFRTRDDFGCEDWEWLLRHHGEDNEDVFCEWVRSLFRTALTWRDVKGYGGSRNTTLICTNSDLLCFELH